MTHLNVLPVKAFDDNYIWCIEEQDGQNFMAVDPGDAQVVIDYANKHQRNLSAILVTHHHADHTGGIAALVDHFGSVPIYGPQNSPYKGISNTLSEGNTVDVFSQTFDVLEIPGHTLDHIAYHCADLGLLFCGDTLFLAGCGRVFEGTPQQMHLSLQKIMALPAMTKAYPTHEYSLANLAFAMQVEPSNEALQLAQTMCLELRAEGLVTLPTRLAQESAINPFVRTQHTEVIASAEKHSETTLHSCSDVFAALRAWKNVA